MPIGSEERAKEVLRRMERIRQKRRAAGYAALSAAGGFALIVGLSFAVQNIAPAEYDLSGQTGATLLAGGGLGGYVLIGVISFVIGIAVATVYLKKPKG